MTVRTMFDLLIKTRCLDKCQHFQQLSLTNYNFIREVNSTNVNYQFDFCKPSHFTLQNPFVEIQNVKMFDKFYLLIYAFPLKPVINIYTQYVMCFWKFYSKPSKTY